MSQSVGCWQVGAGKGTERHDKSSTCLNFVNKTCLEFRTKKIEKSFSVGINHPLPFHFSFHPTAQRKRGQQHEKVGIYNFAVSVEPVPPGSIISLSKSLTIGIYTRKNMTFHS